MWAKIITIKRTKDLNYFSLCALNLFNTRVSQFELNYWNKWTFPRHSNLLRCTCKCFSEVIWNLKREKIKVPHQADSNPGRSCQNEYITHFTICTTGVDNNQQSVIILTSPITHWWCWWAAVLPDWADCLPIGLLLIDLDRRLTHWAGRQNLGCF